MEQNLLETLPPPAFESLPQTQPKQQIKEHIWQWFGLDVSKDSFTAAYYSGLPDTKKSEVVSFESSRKGVKKFLSWRKKHTFSDYPSAIVMESTGYYSRNLTDIFLKLDSSIHVSICNARSVSYYIKSHAENKTDQSDARFISRYGYDFQPLSVKIKSRDEKLLKEFVSERMKVVKMMTMLTNKSHSLEYAETKAINKGIIDFLNKKKQELDKKIVEVSKLSVEMDNEIALIDSVPGIGRVSASVIYAELGSLKQYTRLQLSGMSGLFPKISQSGTSMNKSKLAKSGSSNLRQILYMDSIKAIEIIPSLRELRKRLLARENSRKMTAMCACMRKLLLIAKGVVDSGIPYDPSFQQKKGEVSQKTA